MRTAPRPTTDAPEPHAQPPVRPWGERLAPVAGPLLISVAVLVAMRAYAFTDLLSNSHPDLLAQWLPRFCYLGESIADGRIPLWNPHQMAGLPYAADPQSGWLHLGAMAASTAFPCSRALGALIALQPLMAGLGLWWFLRREGLSRTAATAAGLSIGLGVAGSQVALSLPFAATLAWTPFLLVGASGFLDASSLPARLAWLALGALAWGQVAAAHLSHGLLMASILLVAHLAARVIVAARRAERGGGRGTLLAAALLGALVAANLAILLPRLDLLPHTSLREGYAGVDDRLTAVAGEQQVAERAVAERGIHSGWPFSLGVSPGAYTGAAILLAVPAALRNRRHRGLAAAMAASALLAWVATLDLLLASEPFRDLVLRLPFGDVYLHNPGRLRFLVLVAVPVLGAIGIDGFRERPIPARRAAAWVALGAGICLLLPLSLGARPLRFGVLMAGATLAAPALVALAGSERRAARAWNVAWLLPGLLAVDLSASVAFGQAYLGGTIDTGLEPPGATTQPFGPVRWPRLPASAYLADTPIVEALRDRPGRFLTWYPPFSQDPKGFLFAQRRRDWPALANSQAMALGLADAQGYSPIQVPRYWTYVRAVNRRPIFYNAGFFDHPTEAVVRLLGVGHLIAPSGVVPPVAGREVLRFEGFSLWRVEASPAIVSVVGRWSVVDAPGALRAVLDDAFDPAREAVIERDPGIPSSVGEGAGSARLQISSPEEVRISVDTSRPAIVVVRAAWDRNWRATVDGRPVDVLRTDFLLQGIAVPAGRHDVRLVYRDPALFLGLALSGLAWAILAVAIAVALAVQRRGRDRLVLNGSDAGSDQIPSEPSPAPPGPPDPSGPPSPAARWRR
jgi:hypothetical protein